MVITSPARTGAARCGDPLAVEPHVPGRRRVRPPRCVCAAPARATAIYRSAGDPIIGGSAPLLGVGFELRFQRCELGERRIGSATFSRSRGCGRGLAKLPRSRWPSRSRSRPRRTVLARTILLVRALRTRPARLAMLRAAPRLAAATPSAGAAGAPAAAASARACCGRRWLPRLAMTRALRRTAGTPYLDEGRLFPPRRQAAASAAAGGVAAGLLARQPRRALPAAHRLRVSLRFRQPAGASAEAASAAAARRLRALARFRHSRDRLDRAAPRAAASAGFGRCSAR